jgi:hypothetical protein
MLGLIVICAVLAVGLALVIYGTLINFGNSTNQKSGTRPYPLPPEP